MRCEWDPEQDEANRAKHDLSFQEASDLFTTDADYLEIYDQEHSDEEDRFIAIGPIKRGVVVVAYAEREEGVLRIVSARMATRKERRRYEEYQGKSHGR